MIFRAEIVLGVWWFLFVSDFSFWVYLAVVYCSRLSRWRSFRYYQSYALSVLLVPLLLLHHLTSRSRFTSATSMSAFAPKALPSSSPNSSLSGHCWTSSGRSERTAGPQPGTFRVRWALRDVNRDFRSLVSIAGPQPLDRMLEDTLDQTRDSMSDRMPEDGLGGVPFPCGAGRTFGGFGAFEAWQTAALNAYKRPL